MDPNMTGRERPVGEEGNAAAPAPPPAMVPPPARVPPPPTASPPVSAPTSGGRPLSRLPLGRRGATAVAVVAVIALVGGLVAVGGGLLGGAAGSPAPGGFSAAGASASGTGGATSSPASSASASLAASSAATGQTPTPTPRGGDVPLPGLLAAIGDSYTQAWSVSSAYRYDHPQFSWAIGTSKTDGVLSLLERFRALGGSPVVVDAATSGKTIDDAQRQATVVVEAARKLAPGKTAYVTFELGTNDLCASPNPMTDPGVFESDLGSAMATLRAGLPTGSRVLMLAIPDFPHFHDITNAYPAAKSKLARAPSDQCAPYLGTNGPSSRSAADARLAQYDASLKAACDDINVKESATGRLYCTYDQALLAESGFTIKDLSTVDYFHPSLSGQAKMAADAWRADAWASRTLP